MQNLERYLEGRVAVVTGGFSGIGWSIGNALAVRGAAVALGGRTVRNDAADALRSRDVPVFCDHLDVREVDSIRHFVNTVQTTLGPIDILVNSAGIGISQTVCDHPEDAWNDVLDTNLSGPFRMTRACLPGMIERRWGRIIHIGSTAARTAVAQIGSTGPQPGCGFGRCSARRYFRRAQPDMGRDRNAAIEFSPPGNCHGLDDSTRDQ